MVTRYYQFCGEITAFESCLRALATSCTRARFCVRHHALCVYTGRLHRTVGLTRSQNTAQPHPISRGVCTLRGTQIPDHSGRESRISWSTTSPEATKGTGPYPNQDYLTRSDFARPPHRPTDLGHAPCDGPLKRVFNIDITQCPHCGERLRVIADITQPDLIHAILKHRIERPPTADTARAPPVKAPVRKVSAAKTDSLTA